MYRTLGMATVALAGLAGVANAAVTTYTSSAAFSAATSGVTSYTFSIPVGATGTSVNEGSSYTRGPLQFTDTSIYLNFDGAFGVGVVYVGGYDSPTAGTDFAINVSGAPTAISFNIGTYNPYEVLRVSVNGAVITTIPGIAGAPATTFFGITDTSPVTSVVFRNITTPGDEINIVGFATGSMITVSEPASIALLGVGLVGLTLVRQRPDQRVRQKS